MVQARRPANRECDDDWVSAPDLDCPSCIERTRRLTADVARRNTSTGEDADDVASEALAAILTARKFDPARGSFPTFVRLVVTSKARMFHRRSARARRNVEAAGPFLLQSSDADRALREAELEMMMSDALQDFSPVDREAFSMHLAGYSRAEIADAIEVNGRRITPQRWGARLVPIQKHVASALQLRLQAED